MRSLLIKDTTEDERRQIVEDALGYTEGFCDSCQIGVIEMYDDYIYGKKELREVTMAFNARYVSGKEAPDPGYGSSGCRG